MITDDDLAYGLKAKLWQELGWPTGSLEVSPAEVAAILAWRQIAFEYQVREEEMV